MNTTTTEAVTELPSRQTRAERMRQPLAADVVAAVAEQHGVCVRPFTMEVGDPDTGELRYVPMPCGSTVESVCGPCARKARALRMAQCREGWHLAEEPLFTVDEPTPEQRAQLTTRADLVAHYRDAVHHERAGDADELRETIRETDEKLRQLGVRGRLPSPDAPAKRLPKRSTRRRQDVPKLPTRQVRKTTLGREFAGRYRPSMFLTLTCDSYGRVREDRARRSGRVSSSRPSFSRRIRSLSSAEASTRCTDARGVGLRRVLVVMTGAASAHRQRCR
jgi:hypothetical protein